MARDPGAAIASKLQQELPPMARRGFKSLSFSAWTVSGRGPDEAFAALEGLFRRLGLRWYLFGAQAALLHRAARPTRF